MQNVIERIGHSMGWVVELNNKASITKYLGIFSHFYLVCGEGKISKIICSLFIINLMLEFLLISILLI